MIKKMERTEFLKAFSNSSSEINEDRINSILKANTDYIGDGGTTNIIISMEECAELQQALSKFLRGKGDIINLTEECADVLLSIYYIKQLYGVTDDDINKAINVKIDRIERRLKANKKGKEKW